MDRKFSITKTAGWQKIAPVWNRYQIGRLLILMVMTLFLAGSAYGIVNAKTAHVSSLQQSLSQTTDVYDNSGDKAG